MLNQSISTWWVWFNQFILTRVMFTQIISTWEWLNHQAHDTNKSCNINKMSYKAKDHTTTEYHKLMATFRNKPHNAKEDIPGQLHLTSKALESLNFKHGMTQEWLTLKPSEKTKKCYDYNIKINS
jgi:hypothetical protein